MLFLEVETEDRRDPIPRCPLRLHLKNFTREPAKNFRFKEMFTAASAKAQAQKVATLRSVPNVAERATWFKTCRWGVSLCRCSSLAVSAQAEAKCSRNSVEVAAARDLSPSQKPS